MKTIRHSENCKRLLCLFLAVLTVASILLPASAPVAFAAEKTVIIPDPADYFGKVIETEKGERNNAYNFEGFTSFPKSKVESYYNALKKLGLTTRDKASSSIIDFKDNGKTVVQISWDSQRGKIRVNVVKPLTIGKVAGDTTITTTTTKPSVLDIVERHFGTKGKPSYDKKNYETVYQFKSLSDAEKKLNAFVNEMEKMGAKCYVTSFSSSGGSKTFSVDWGVGGSLVTGKWTKKDNNVRVTVRWEYVEKSGKFDEKEIPEREVEPTVKPTPGKKDCSWCGGDGKCSDCSGRGYKMKWVSGTKREYVQQDCTSCSIPGKCRYCNGSGKK